ncbi:hypothetical protein BAE44_0022717, partial [Dichanthelium oligosanthes]
MACKAALELWNDLPADLAESIARCLPCPFDRFCMSRVCSTWRRGVRHLQKQPIPPPTPLPWFLLPYRRVCDHPRRGTRYGRFFCVLCNRIHRVRVPLNTGGARFFGAYQGGWIFIAYGQNRRHVLIYLPVLHTQGRPGNRLPDVVSWNGNPERRMFILAATLSAPPVPSKNCVAAAIIMTIPVEFPKLITIWRMGSLRPTFCRTTPMDVEDVIYHNDAFYFINRDLNLLECKPNFQEEAPLEQLEVRTKELRFLPMMIIGDGADVRARYLVESRGELLMVVRLSLDQKETSSFSVFRIMRPHPAHADYCWDELPELGGRMIFVEHGCSISYEVADFHGSQEGVYFHDECFYDDEVRMIYDNRGRDREYPCSDNGRCSELPDDVQCLYRAFELTEKRLVFDGVVHTTFMEGYWKQGKDKEAMDNY